MLTFALLVATFLVRQTPQEGPLDREEVRRRLISLTHPGCGLEGPERHRKLVQIALPALEELPLMIKEAKEDQLRGLLSLYLRLVLMKEPTETPTIILNLARGPTNEASGMAAIIALTIMDDRAIEFLIEGLNHVAADETGLEWTLLERAGWSHSNKVGEVLLKLLKHPGEHLRAKAIEAIGNLGYGPALDELRTVAQRKDMLGSSARVAIQKIEILSSPDRDRKLIEPILRYDSYWPPWCLDQILHLKLTGLAADLRTHYDDLLRRNGPAVAATEPAAKRLHAIYKLGGKVSKEELDLLHTLGRLPPALPTAGRTGPPEELAKGFHESVWAPRELRLFKAAVRRAPPPRIPEQGLPTDAKERIRFVLGLKTPDPSYLAPCAARALAAIEVMLETERDEKELDKLLSAYQYLVPLREGWLTSGVMLRLARNRRAGSSIRAMEIVATIADKEAEALFLEGLQERDAGWFINFSAKLNSPKVRDAILRFFREDNSPVRESAIRALGDMGCVEALEDLRKLEVQIPGPSQKQEIRLAITKIETLSAPDHDRKLLDMVKSLRMSGEFSHYGWALDQIVRLKLKKLAPELRAWHDGRKWLMEPSFAPHSFRVRLIHSIRKLGGALTSDEEALLKKCGRLP